MKICSICLHHSLLFSSIVVIVSGTLVPSCSVIAIYSSFLRFGNYACELISPGRTVSFSSLQERVLQQLLHRPPVELILLHRHRDKVSKLVRIPIWDPLNDLLLCDLFDEVANIVG